MMPVTLSGVQKGLLGFPVGSAVRNLPASVEDMGSIPGEGNGNPLQYFCLRNPMDRGAWQATVHGVIRIGRD